MNRILCIKAMNSLYLYSKEEMELQVEKNEFSVLMLQVIKKMLKNMKKALEIRVLEIVEKLIEFSVLNFEFSVLRKRVTQANSPNRILNSLYSNSPEIPQKCSLMTRKGTQ